MPTKTVNARYLRVAQLGKDIARLANILTAEMTHLTISDRPDIVRIQEATCKAYNVTLEALVGPGRTNQVAEARQVSMYLCRTHTPCSAEQVGNAHGGRTGGTVLHAEQTVKDRKGTDPKFLDRYINCFNTLNNPQ